MSEPQRQSEVRRQVRELLGRSPAYHTLAPADRRELANHMVRVGTYLADPNWLAAAGPHATPLADGDPLQDLKGALAMAAPAAPTAAALGDSDPVQDLKARLADDQGSAGADFKAGAMREGVEAFGNLISKVDFPSFVSGLVNGVFKAVVDASIEQMKAYGELLAAAVKTVDQFASDHISDAEVRDGIAAKYPGAVRVDTSGDVARLRPVEGVEDDALDLAKEYGLENSVDLTDDDSEAALIAAAKLELARSRQQLMATMVLLGIQRIVITDGKINAKVVFDINTEDTLARKSQAQMHDRTRSSQSSRSASIALGWGAAAARDSRYDSSHTTSVSSAVDDTSESKAKMKAQLSGDVKLSFKSETFPLERMVDAGGLALLNARAAPTNPAAPAGPAAPGAAAPATSPTK